MTSPSAPTLPLNRLTALSRRSKQTIMVAIDVIVALTTMWLAFSLRYGVVFVPYSWQQLFIIALAPTLAVPIFIRLGLYRAIFRFGGIGAITTIVRAVSIYTVLFAAVVVVLWFPGVPRTVAIIQPVLFAWAILAVRSFSGFLLTSSRSIRETRERRERLLIFGAGLSGLQTFSALNGSREYDVVGFIDDQPDKIGGQIAGRTVYGRDDVERLVRDNGVEGVLLALPHASRQVRSGIIQWLHPFKLHVRSVPSVLDMAAGKITLNDVRELELEDLLARPPAPRDEAIASYVGGQVVLVTGAGGSIGSELCRQIQRAGPAKLLLAEISEAALYAIHNELSALQHRLTLNVELIPLLCDVRSRSRVEALFSTWQPGVVYHAAAYKHVPLVEHNAAEGIDNNVLGTLNVAQAALASGSGRFVLVSTDKAVRPTNIMGASKRMAEIVLQALAAEPAAGDKGPRGRTRTVFTMVRFGNVLGSSGSVVPLFRQQLAAGGPLTVTHPEVTRYFMTIPEAAQLVLEAGAMALGGEVFLLHMGEPVKIIDLARRIIELGGFTVRDDACPDGEIPIEITGMRPGEKLYEELLIDDNALSTSNVRIMQARDRMWPWSGVSADLNRLRMAVTSGDIATIRAILAQYVDGFSEKGSIVDFVHVEQSLTEQYRSVPAGSLGAE